MPGRTLLHFELLETLGKGRMGVVYKTRQPPGGPRDPDAGLVTREGGHTALDERYILWTQADHPGSDLMMIENFR